MTGVLEVPLGIEYKMHNIEQTEAAKRRLLSKSAAAQQDEYATAASKACWAAQAAHAVWLVSPKKSCPESMYSSVFAAVLSCIAIALEAQCYWRISSVLLHTSAAANWIQTICAACMLQLLLHCHRGSKK